MCASSFISYLLLNGNRYVRNAFEGCGLLSAFGLLHSGKGQSSLLPLEPFEKCGKASVRILGLNPSLHTLQGTNTYLIGSGRERILVDTGDRATAEQYVTYLLGSIFPETGTEGICAIILTHRHYDHIGGVSYLLKELSKRGHLQPKVYLRHTKDSLQALKVEGFEAHDISDGQIFTCEGGTLEVLHTSGHCDDHVSLIMHEDRALLCGDCILGCGTAVFDDLFNLMNSLHRIKDLFSNKNKAKRLDKLLPGHGPIIRGEMASLAKIDEYLQHRNLREFQILQILKRGRDKSLPVSSWDIVMELYPAEQYSFLLRLAAQTNVTHHLIKLRCEKRVFDTWPDQWALVDDSCGKGNFDIAHESHLPHI